MRGGAIVRGLRSMFTKSKKPGLAGDFSSPLSKPVDVVTYNPLEIKNPLFKQSANSANPAEITGSVVVKPMRWNQSPQTVPAGPLVKSKKPEGNTVFGFKSELVDIGGQKLKPRGYAQNQVSGPNLPSKTSYKLPTTTFSAQGFTAPRFRASLS